MDFYFIPPNKHLDLMHLGNRYFCLAHFYLQDEAYRKYFLTLREQQPEGWITLDNGAAEGELIETEQLIEIVKELKPNEVVAPDYLLEAGFTLSSYIIFADKMEHYNLFDDTQLFVCPQAANEEEYLEAFSIIAADERVSTLGLSKITIPYCFANKSTGDTNIETARPRAVDRLIKEGLLTKDIHLLGMGRPEEFSHYLNLRANLVSEAKFIRSSDSCYSILAAWHGLSFVDGETIRVPTTDDYYSAQLSRKQITIAVSNIAYMMLTYTDSNKDTTLQFLDKLYGSLEDIDLERSFYDFD